MSMVSMCGFTVHMYVLASGWEFRVPVVNLCVSLRATGPQIHSSIHPSIPVDWPSSLEDSRLCCSKHTPLAAHGPRENSVIRPGSDNLNWLYSD